MKAVILDLDYSMLLPGENGAQTRHMSKRARLRHGSRTSRGNVVIFIDPHKGIHDDENNVCL